jgi:hypothetical protein
MQNLQIELTTADFLAVCLANRSCPVVAGQARQVVEFHITSVHR